MLGSVSIAISSRARSSRGAVAGSYVFAFLVAFFTVATLLAELLVVRPEGGSLIPPRGREFYSSWLNPYVAMVDAVDAPLSLRSEFSLTPFTPVEALLYARQGISNGGVLGGGGVGFGLGVTEVGDQFFPENVDDAGRQLVRMRRGPVWIRTLIIYLTISALSLLRAARVVRAPAANPFRLKRNRHASV
jgi:hypothetical protein